MKTTSKTFALLFCLSLITQLGSCNFASNMQDMVEKSMNITKVMQNNCDCDEVSIMEYQTTNLVTTASYKLVGCEFEDFDKETLRIKTILQDSIPGFCDIDHFNLVFVNKGERMVKSFSKCKEK